jgi:hypothetical protein
VHPHSALGDRTITPLYDAPRQPPAPPQKIPAPVVNIGRGITEERTAHVDASPAAMTRTFRTVYAAAVFASLLSAGRN